MLYFFPVAPPHKPLGGPSGSRGTLRLGVGEIVPLTFQEIRGFPKKAPQNCHALKNPDPSKMPILRTYAPVAM